MSSTALNVGKIALKWMIQVYPILGNPDIFPALIQVAIQEPQNVWIINMFRVFRSNFLHLKQPTIQAYSSYVLAGNCQVPFFVNGGLQKHAGNWSAGPGPANISHPPMASIKHQGQHIFLRSSRFEQSAAKKRISQDFTSQ